MKTLRVVHVVRDLRPSGGVSGVVAELHEAMKRQGVASEVLTMGAPPAASPSPLRHMLNVIRFTFASTWEIKRRKRSGDPSVFIVHNEALAGDIYVDHGLHKAVVASKPLLLFRNPLHLFLLIREELRHRLRMYKRVVALSKYSVEQLGRFYPYIDRRIISVIPNGVNVDKYFPAAGVRADANLRLIFVGNEFERKGLSKVIEALSRLPENVRLTVVGGDTHSLQRHKIVVDQYRLSHRVTFLGQRCDVPDLFRSHDVMVLPSRFESWGLVVLEAMATGLTVLSTPVGCAEEVITTNVNGILIENTVDSIVAKLTDVLRKKTDLAVIGAAAIQTASGYDWGSIAALYVKLAVGVVQDRE